jgi:hypothetical protein
MARREFAENYQSNSPLSTSHTSTSTTSGGPVTPLEQYSLRQNQPFDSNFDISPTAGAFTKEQFKAYADDYFLNNLIRQQEPLTSKRNSDGIQNGQSSFNSSNIYNTNQYQPPSEGNWSASPSATTSPPVRKLHDYSSRKSSVQNSNLSYTSSSTPASQFDNFLALTPLTTPGGQINSHQQSSSGFPFYPNSDSKNMSSTQSPLGSMPEELDYQDMTTTQNFTDSALTKRTRAEGRSDTISACWTSPLCPNHADPRDGTPPNPATCGGGCAPFLFGEEPLPESINDASLDMAVVSVDQLSINSRSQAQQQQNQQQDKSKAQRVPKRSDTDNKHEDKGRSLSKTTPNIKQSSSPEANIMESIESSKKNSRQPHNKVEQKYRDSINNQMEALRKVIPSLSESARACSDDADIEDLPVPSKPSKAVILASATAFIKAQTKEKRQLEAENLLLRQRVQALQALVKCDDCSLMQYVVDLNLRNGTNTDPLSMR